MSVLRRRNIWANTAAHWPLVILAATTPLLCSCKSLPNQSAAKNSQRSNRAAQVVSREAYDARKVAARPLSPSPPHSLTPSAPTPPSPALLAASEKYADEATAVWHANHFAIFMFGTNQRGGQSIDQASETF